MTTKFEWKEYTGSDEQIAEIGNSINANGFITKNISGLESSVVCSDTTHYWIIPDDQLREMKVRWAMTGQPVWYKHRFIESTGECGTFHHPFIQPETYEYSFTAFEDQDLIIVTKQEES